MNNSENNLPKSIGLPATRALQGAKIVSLKQVMTLSDKELLAMHGVGPKAVRILREESKKLGVTD